MTTELVPYEQRIGALSISDVKSQVNLIQHVMREVMQEGEHYGAIPGFDSKKKSLFKAGAEKLCLTFRLDPQYEIEQKQDGIHREIISKCILWHVPSGQRFGSGMGSCSTRESKYAYRSASVKCPFCGTEAIIKGKEEYGGGFVCFKKKGGCGAKFDDNDERITKQHVGRIPNEDVADQYNTVLKMANKRSLVAAVLNATAASDIFTQDIEDMVDVIPASPAPKEKQRTVPELQVVLTAIAAMKTKPERDAAKALADKLEDAEQIAMAEDAWKIRIRELKETTI